MTSIHLKMQDVKDVKTVSARQDTLMKRMEYRSQIAALKSEYTCRLIANDSDGAAGIREKLVDIFGRYQEVERAEFFADLDTIARNATASAREVAAAILRDCRVEPDESGGFRAVSNGHEGVVPVRRALVPRAERWPLRRAGR